MIREWISFQRENEDVRVFLDRGVKERIDYSQFSTLLNLSLNIYHIAEKKEQVTQIQEELIELQEKLDSSILEANQGVFIGRIDSETRIELIFYVRDPEKCKEMIKNGLTLFARFRYVISSRIDEQWDFYDYLSPNTIEAEYYNNYNAIHSFYYEGYKTDVEYRVHYYLRFQNSQDLLEAAESLKRHDYTVENIDYDAEGIHYKHVLHLSLACFLNEDSLNKNTLMLIETVSKVDGRYEGWGIFPKERPIRKIKAAFKKIKYYGLVACFILILAAIGMYVMRKM
ncbi:DUF695 domain-containing protein [Paenibacillus radicis (ex Xue et al. 2023)]|uniref:DUF695 domain-containing protein n=1 Tax=Paenibacillus radicis (ex Xue et al. 2023) TaxID=2972489 RepID=A0ABT1YFF8_9BACL|nr:DUF695 domain-containing protein [Paenibacillus radicis (ex Xue et al. 2023)]MCR8631924.1 DUF695 domain-containing protein [Paenibacillus radicis (ex Xue et al. 2023)]